MSIATDKARIEGAKADLAAWLSSKGVTVPNATKLDGLVSLLNSVQGGTSTQHQSGTVRTNASGAASVNCGFVPDIVVLWTNDLASGEAEWSSATGAVLPFYKQTQNGADGVFATITINKNGGGAAEFYASRTSNGFEITESYWLGWTWNYDTLLTNYTLNYEAYKFFGETGNTSGGVERPEWYSHARKLTYLFDYGNDTSQIQTGSSIEMDLSDFPNLASVEGLFQSGFSQRTSNFFGEITLRLPNRPVNCAKLFFNSSLYNTTIHTINLPNGLRTTECQGIFSRLRAVRNITGVIDFSNANALRFSDNTGNGTFYDCQQLQNVEFASNSIPDGATGWWLGSCAALLDNSIISIANALGVTSSSKTLTLHATPKARLSAIMGTVTGGIFTANPTGTMSLSQFITNIKGWTIA